MPGEEKNSYADLHVKSAINLIRFDWHQASQIDRYYAYFRFAKFSNKLHQGVKQIDVYERFIYHLLLMFFLLDFSLSLSLFNGKVFSMLQ